MPGIRGKDEIVYKYGQVEIIRARRPRGHNFHQSHPKYADKIVSSIISVIAFIHRPRTSIGKAISKLLFVLLNVTMGILRPPNNRRQVAMLNHQNPGVHSTQNDLHNRS